MYKKTRKNTELKARKKGKGEVRKEQSKKEKLNFLAFSVKLNIFSRNFISTFLQRPLIFNNIHSAYLTLFLLNFLYFCLFQLNSIHFHLIPAYFSVLLFISTQFY